MFVGVFGVPSTSTVLGTEIVRTLLATCYGVCEVVSTANPQDVKDFWVQGRQSAIFYSERPEESLIRFLLDEQVPIIVFLNGFAATSRALVAVRGMTALEAIRAASLSFAALKDAVSEKNVLIISSHKRINDVYNLLRQITRFLGFEASSDAIGTTTQSLQFSNDNDGGVYLESQTANATSADPGVIAQVDALSDSLKDYDQLIERGFIHTLTWPGTVFHLLDKGAGPAIESVDLSGLPVIS